MMKVKKWNILVVVSVWGMLLMLAIVTGLIDPYLHYHKPLSFLQYPLKDERYLNDGIARNYEYEAMITGTSMAQNFKASEMEQLWQVPVIKTAFSGASYHELNESIKRAISYNPDLKYVLCSLDGSRLNYDAYTDSYEGYPEYLYDNNLFNDVNYLLNKEVVTKTIAVLNYTRAGNRTTTMDEYGSWSIYKVFGKEAVLASVVPKQAAAETVSFTEEDRARVTENIEANYLKTALENPDITFYFFFPPYSIYYWEGLVQSKQLEAQLQAEELAVELLTQAENIHVFGFSDRIDITANLDNYMDILHFGEWINSEIMQAIYNGEQELTKENYREYYRTVKELYQNYNYDM